MYEVLILAGGKAQRLRPYSEHTPKHLLKLGGKPAIYYLLKEVDVSNFKRAALIISKDDELTEKVLGKLNIKAKVDVIHEKKPKGTAGAVKDLEDEVSEDFLVLYSDNLSNLNLKKFLEFHKEKNSYATIASSKLQIPLEYGVIISGQEQNVKEVLEKPLLTHYVSLGYFAFSKMSLEFMKEGEDIMKHTIPALLNSKKPVFHYFEEETIWVDIGTVKKYEEAKAFFDFHTLFFHLNGGKK